LTRHRRNVARSTVVAAVLVLSISSCRNASAPADRRASTAVARGGEIVASVHTDPRSFNRLAARDSTTALVSTLTQAKLVRINQVSQDVEPWLAEKWSRSDDGLRYTLTLRSGTVFSDGHPFTADDVVFSLDAVNDERTGSALADSLQVGGKKLTATAADPQTVVFTFPTPFAPGVRILDNLPILPKHKLGAALKDGTLARAWGIGTPPGDIVGLGPFVLADYAPGQRMAFTRNPHYWRKDASGQQLPYLDRITIEIIPDQDAEMLRLQAGQIDMTTSEIRPEDYAPLKRAAADGKIKLLDVGEAYDADLLWFNLKPGGLGKDPRAAWLQRDELRRAISLAVDRQMFANTVFLGAGVPLSSPVTPANTQWYWTGTPQTPLDPAHAKTVLASIGLTDKNGDGTLEDAQNAPARFTLITQKGRSSLERGAAVIRDELKKIGLGVDVVALDGAAVIQRLLSANYDAIYFDPGATDTDPAINPDFWFSFGTAHPWNLAQKTPATDWEKRVDALMLRQIASPDLAERKKLFDEVQQIFAEHLPVVAFAAPRIYVAVASRVTNLTPAITKPQLLWSPDTIAVAH
jgi:peptide/nickel transport system substrate-binding protein